MARVVYGSGSVTVAVDGTLERTLRAAVDGATKGLATTIETLVDDVATDARGDWYDQVNKRTGKSEKSIDTEMRVTTDTVTGVVYADDKTTYMIRRPGPLSMLSPTSVLRNDEYAKVYAYVMENKQFPPGYKGQIASDGHPYRVRRMRPNPKASDGKNMWQENVKKPGKKRITQQIGTIKKAAKKAVKDATRG